MATGRFIERLSATQTPFPTSVERFRQLCRVHGRRRLWNFKEIVCWLNQLKAFMFGAPAQDLWTCVCNVRPCGSRKKC
jgi:hypothetical protein